MTPAAQQRLQGEFIGLLQRLQPNSHLPGEEQPSPHLIRQSACPRSTNADVKEEEEQEEE